MFIAKAAIPEAEEAIPELWGNVFLVSILNSSSEYQSEELAKKIISDFAEINILINEKKNQFLKKTVCIGFEV